VTHVFGFTPVPPVEYQTRCDYESIEPDELSFKKQQRVEILEARLDGWWKVKWVPFTLSPTFGLCSTRLLIKSSFVLHICIEKEPNQN